MGQRNVPWARHIHDLKSEQNHPYTNQYLPMGHGSHNPNQSVQHIQSTAGNAPIPNFQFRGHGGNLLYGNHYNNLQYYHPISNSGLGGPAVPNIYDPYASGSSSRSLSNLANNVSPDNVPTPTNIRTTGVVTDEHAEMDGLRRACKRKITEAVPGKFYLVNDPENSNMSSASVPPSSELHTPALPQGEHQRQGIYPITEGSDTRSQSSFINNPPQPTLLHDSNYLLQGNLIGHSSQHPANAYLEQFGNRSGNEDSNWNHTNGMRLQHGRSINPGPVEIAEMGVARYQHTSSNRNPVFISHYPPFPPPYQQMPPVQSMQVSGYGHHSGIPAPSFWHPLDNWHHNYMYPSGNGIESTSTFAVPFPPIQPTPYDSSQGLAYGGFQILSEDEAALQFQQIGRLEELTDQHRDMRLDIDDMTYEELLDLEERIGDVNTGLSEESILKNLKTSARSPRSTSSQLDQSSQIASESEACTICQVEYEENETVGTLICGHSYHASCIKQWLLVKNLCPICKKSALPTVEKTERREEGELVG